MQTEQTYDAWLKMTSVAIVRAILNEVDKNVPYVYLTSKSVKRYLEKQNQREGIENLRGPSLILLLSVSLWSKEYGWTAEEVPSVGTKVIFRRTNNGHSNP
jgi:hypothetical protein